MNALVEFLKSFGLVRLGMIIGVTAGVAIALALIMTRVGSEPYRVLYADLDYSDAQTTIAALDQSGTKFKMRERGSRVSILVPRDEISTIRINLASQGIGLPDNVGYEIFDTQQSLGTTSFQQSINRVRALEGELARSISSLAGIRSARVHLVMPERSLFSRDTQQATASIVLDAPPTFNPVTIRAITNMVASAVPDLSPEHVTVLDINGTLLAAAMGDQSETMADSMMADRMLAAERRLQTTVADMIGRIVGPQNVRVQVAADFDFSRFTETAEIIDPDSQTVLSSSIIEESTDDQRPVGQQGVSVSNGLPGAALANSDTNATSQNRRSEEVTNYEITKTVRNAVRDEGLVLNNLSVAVAINNRDSQGVVTPRTADELSQLEALVKSAVGFSEARGDQVEIVDISFVAAPQAPILPTQNSPSVSSFLPDISVSRMAELAALTVLAFGVIFFVFRPLLAASSSAPTQTSIAQAGLGHSGGMEHIIPHTQDQSANTQSEGGIEQRINISQIEGKVHASSVKQIQEIVKGHTDESASILKRWIGEAT